MFGKKKQQSYPLQVLTPELLIEGSYDGEPGLYGFSKHDQLNLLPLGDAQIQTTGAEELPKRFCSQFVVSGNQAIALIPGIDITQLPEYEVWKLYKNPLLGVFYAGPYVIEGKAMLTAAKYLTNPLLVVDVRITSRVAGARWSGLYAPFVLVNSLILAGYEPRQ